jgi:hypothetical protein
MKNIVILKKNKNVLTKQVEENDLSESLNSVLDKRIKLNSLPEKLYRYDINGINNIKLVVWGYIDGRENQVNQHDLPPSAVWFNELFKKSDTDLLYGDMFVLKYENDSLVDLTKEEYAVYYEKLFGGFEDLGDTDSELSQDSEPTQEDLDFIVDDDQELDTDSDWDQEDLSSDSESDSGSQSDTESESDNIEDIENT